MPFGGIEERKPILWRWDVHPGGPLSTFCPSKDVPQDSVCVHQTQL